MRKKRKSRLSAVRNSRKHGSFSCMTDRRSERILILGGGGTLGHKLWQSLSQRFPDTYVTLRKSKSYYAKCPLFKSSSVVDKLDLRDLDALARTLSKIKPVIVANCAGVTLRSKEAGDKPANIETNALLPHRLEAWCAKNSARLIHFSTVCVFDGKKGGYDENSPSDALDLYGRTKSLGEVTGPCALTLRSSFIGRELFGGTELLEWFLDQKGKKIKGYRKALFTGLSTNRFAELVGDIIEKFPGLNGLYHVSSEVLSKYDLLVLMKAAFKLEVEIEPDDSFECRRDLNGIKFAKAAGFSCPPWKRLMAELAADPTPYEKWRQ